MTTKTETTWTRYRRRTNHTLKYDVETMIGRPVEYTFQGEACFKIRTVRNLFYREEIHIPAYTYLPVQEFTNLYQRV